MEDIDPNVDKQTAFIQALKSNQGFISKIAFMYTNDVEDRNDLVQETKLQLWKSFDSFNNQSTISTWMYRVAMNVAITHLKASKKKVQTVFYEAHNFDTPEEQEFENDERLQAFRQQIENLTPIDKAIVLLYLEEKRHDEIAAILGISTSNVGTKLLRIKEKLKTKILNQEHYGLE